MDKYVAALLATALVLPVGLFLLLWPYFHWSALAAALVAVASGWGLNVAWALAARRAVGPSQAEGNTVSIAAYFGWACPAVLVLLTWLAWRFMA